MGGGECNSFENIQVHHRGEKLSDIFLTSNVMCCYLVFLVISFVHRLQ